MTPLHKNTPNPAAHSLVTLDAYQKNQISQLAPVCGRCFQSTV